MVQIVAPADTPINAPIDSQKLGSRIAPEPLPQPPTSETALDRLTIGDQSAVDSGAITQSAIRGVTPPHLAGEDSDATSPNAVATAIDGSGQPTPPPQQGQTRAPNSESDSGHGEASDYRREIEGVWQSESTRRKKQLLLVTLLSLFGLVSAGVVFSQFVRVWRSQQSASQSTNSDKLDATENSSESVHSPSATEVDAEPQQPSKEPEPAASVAETLPSNAPPPESANADNANSTNTSPVPEASSNVPPLNMSPLTSPIGQPNSALKPGEVPPVETSAIIGDRDATAVIPADDDRPDPPPMNDLPPGLAQYLPMANLLTAGNQAAAPMQPPPTIDSVRIDEAAMAAEPEADAATKREPIKLDSVLAQRFAIGNQGATLADLLLVISSLTTVPIELELIALDVAGIKVDVPITTPNGWMTAKQWIDSTCAGLGLVANPNDGRIMIAVDKNKLDEELAVAFQLDDFGDQSREAFEWMKPLLVADETAAPVDEPRDEPQIADVTSLSEDGRTIVPGNTLRSKMHALFAVESTRMIRGMPTKLERWRTSRWMGPWSEKHQPDDQTTIGEWPLVSGGKEVPVLDAPHAAASLLKSIASLNGAQLLVGWYDATRLGFYPADPMMPYSRDNTSGAVLAEMLGEPGLQTRIIGPSQWYVCSEASYDRFEVFAWFTIPSGSGEAVRQRLANSLSADPDSLPVAFTDTTLLVRCPRYLARQMPRIIEP